MIQPIVEGHGEVQAVPVLLNRLIPELGCFLEVSGKPIRQPRAEIIRETNFKRAFQLARLKPGISAVLVLFDADDDCARDIVPLLRRWSAGTAPQLPCAVVLARREYEAWFLAAVESLRGKRGIRADAAYPQNPEEKRDAKGTLGDLLVPKAFYSATADQPALSAALSLEQAYLRSASFRKLVTEVCRLLLLLGQQPVIPSHWNTQ